MKNSIILLFGLLLSPVMVFAADPELVEVGLSRAYIPTGYDSNDLSRVVVEGYFPNSCYKVGPHEVTIDQRTKSINIKQFAYRYSGVCLQMLIPYNHAVDIGILKAGTYPVRNAKSQKTLGRIPVRLATSSEADDYLYAPVSDASVKVADNGSRFVELEGAFSNSCIQIKKIEVIREAADVLTVLPISEVTNNENCQSGNFPFHVEKELQPLEVGRYLLHVRSLNGSAVTKLFDVSK